MGTNEVREKYLQFFKERGHAEVPSASLVPKDDPTTLFTGSGMQPLLPYFLGKKHPLGTRITNSQKCFRTQDIEEIGDNRHTTFFEMLGNWSFGDYFKKEQLNWIYEFTIEVLGLEPSRLYATVFNGYQNVPRDEETIKILTRIFKKYHLNPREHIFYYGVEKNWWSRVGPPDEMPPGEPGGPTSEIFYDFGPEHRLHENSKYANQRCHPNCDCGRFLEIGNSVFMTYKKQADGSLTQLPRKNIDFGGGLERIVAATQNTPDIFEIDSFKEIIQTLEEITQLKYEGKNQPPMRTIADHLRAATFLIYDGVEPSNKEQGYYLRRLLRRAATKFYLLTNNLSPAQEFQNISRKVIHFYGERYFSKTDPIGKARLSNLATLINDEIERFNQALSKGLRAIRKAGQNQINGEFAFQLYQSYGLPFEITQEVLKKEGYLVHREMFEKAYQKHQKISRASVSKKFKSGLADHSQETIKLHTATHLLHQALREVLGPHVKQKGSNITPERLRFDFSHPQALSKDEIAAVEKLVNEKIAADLAVTCVEKPYQKALEEGALALPDEKYPPIVTVYSIGDFSKEICTGPHVTHTGELGRFKIIKERSTGRGIRRIHAILE